ncbi:hypothetical protein Leryth_024344 [Lithospermum erythrorhizon]|nr:hypothetical protein Leryth_024344 [Lithospermum erythrorhizon]
MNTVSGYRFLTMGGGTWSYDTCEAENKQQVVSLIEYVKSKQGSLMWENEDPTVVRVELPSAALLSALVQSMVDAIFFQGDLRETWGAEALKWATECTSRHLACRSHQIYRALRPCVTNDACVSLLRCLHRCLGNPRAMRNCHHQTEKMPVFEGIQPTYSKGFMSTVSHSVQGFLSCCSAFKTIDAYYWYTSLALFAARESLSYNSSIKSHALLQQI